MEHSHSVRSRAKLIENMIRANRDSEGGPENPNFSSRIHHGKKIETAWSANNFDNIGKAKARYAALIRPSVIVTHAALKNKQGQRQRRRHQSFFDENLNYTIESDMSYIEVSSKTNNLREGSFHSKEVTSNKIEASIYRLRSSSHNAHESPQLELIKDVVTTNTLRTASTLASHSSDQASALEPPQTMSDGAVLVSPSLSTISHDESMVIKTEVSNLTESPSPERRDTVAKTSRFHEGSVTPGDQVLESITRLQELEQKRRVVRFQRFGLEQRLHNIRRVAMVPNTISEEEDDTDKDAKAVVNWKYKAAENLLESKGRVRNTDEKRLSSRCPVPRTIIYTGRLNAAGEPHDNNALLRFADDQIYKGSVRNGLRHGSGTNQWPDGQTYSGEWHNDSRSGRGTHIWADGRTVTGTWKEGHVHGKVFFRWPNGAVFDGTANMGKKEGKGFATHPDGTVYNGNYSNNEKDGYGTLIRSDGVKYRGQFRNGKKEGLGVMLWHTRTYDGEWSNDKPHGQGRVVWSNGAVYTGGFRDGLYSGPGEYSWPSGKTFAGMWEDGVKHGRGVHTWPSGKVYDGQYANGVKEGYGCMTWPDGSMYCGGFRRNRRCGLGIQTDAGGGLVHCGLWKHDRPCLGIPENNHAVPRGPRQPIPPPPAITATTTNTNENEEPVVVVVKASQPSPRATVSDSSDPPGLPFPSPAVITPTGDDEAGSFRDDADSSSTLGCIVEDCSEEEDGIYEEESWL